MLEEKAKQLRLSVLEAIYKAGFAGVGEMMSVVEIVTALYYGEFLGERILLNDSAKPGWDGQDYLVLSRGAMVPVQYAALADLGFFDREEMGYLGATGGLLKTRPNMRIPGVTATLESDGCGLAYSVGLALALDMEKQKNKVFTLMGSEELRDGTVWEAAMAASAHNLSNLIAVVNYPFVEVDTDALPLIKVSEIQRKFEAFGWEVVQVTDGHDFDKLLAGMDKAKKVSRKPVCLWCHTISGKGVEFAERRPGYLKAILSEGEMNEIIPKLQHDQ